MARFTQRDRIINVLRNPLVVPSDYTREIDGELWVSSRWFKQVMLISEANARCSEARGDGFDIATASVKDPWGFAYHRLISSPMKKITVYEVDRERNVAVPITKIVPVVAQ